MLHKFEKDFYMGVNVVNPKIYVEEEEDWRRDNKFFCLMSFLEVEQWAIVRGVSFAKKKLRIIKALMGGFPHEIGCPLRNEQHWEENFGLDKQNLSLYVD